MSLPLLFPDYSSATHLSSSIIIPKMFVKPSPSSLAAALLLAPLARAWRAGTQQTETHPRLTWQRCTGTGGTSCTTVNGEIVLDANWRWLHNSGGYENCYDGNTWSSQYCPSNSQCLSNCQIEGVNYSGTYGITTSGNQCSIRFVTEHEYGTNVGGRVYLMQSATQYQMFNLIGNEFTFDVDVSDLECGLNGALYFVNMPAAGEGSAGARYGLGYCDSQCPRDLKFVGGQVRTFLYFQDSVLDDRESKLIA
jgi:cellulose 1,4-beta-cellobiosidase